MSLSAPITPVSEWQTPSITTPGAVDVVRVQRGLFMVMFATSLSPAIGMTPAAWHDFVAAVKRGEYNSQSHPVVDIDQSPAAPDPSAASATPHPLGGSNVRCEPQGFRTPRLSD